MRRGWRIAAVLAALPVAAPSARADAGDQLSRAQKRAIQSFFQQAFVEPDTVRWTYDRVSHDPRGLLVCGRVDYMNSVHVYVGNHRFYVILKKELSGRSETETKLGFYRSASVDAGDLYDSVADDPGGGLKRRIEGIVRARLSDLRGGREPDPLASDFSVWEGSRK